MEDLSRDSSGGFTVGDSDAAEGGCDCVVVAVITGDGALTFGGFVTFLRTVCACCDIRGVDWCGRGVTLADWRLGVDSCGCGVTLADWLDLAWL